MSWGIHFPHVVFAFAYAFLKSQQTTHHPNIGVEKREVTKLGMSTLVGFILDKDGIHDEGYVCLIGGHE